MLKQITVDEAIRLHTEGSEVKCLIPGPDQEWGSYIPGTLAGLLEGVFFLADMGEEIPPVKKKAKGGSRSKLDDGKILALRNAGWPVPKIADEMGCSPAAVWSHLGAMKNNEEAETEEPDDEERR
jgi:hypothetical protein